MRSLFKRSVLFALLVCMAFLVCPPSANAVSGREIDAGADVALEKFYKDVPGSREVLSKANGVLVFPNVVKAGLGLGGKYGQGTLRVHGKTVDYYRLTAASYGFQLGAEKNSLIVAFMTREALDKFRASKGWQAGVDASVALIKVGASGSLDTSTAKQPVIGFVFNQRGLMYDLSLEGTKFTKIKKKY